MAFNKAKAVANAKRLIDRGQFKKAVGFYERICDAEPADLRARLRLGDLYHRAGNLGGALRVYSDVAGHFAGEGFLLKAVAVYKQMLRIDSGLHSVHVALARVYQQLGLMNDAISQYQEAIAVLGYRGMNVERLYVIRELLELDPDNVRARVRLAEDFATERRVGDAVRELRLAAETLDREGRSEEFVRVAERLLYHQPDNTIVARRLAELHLEQENPQAALPRLQACFRAHPQDVEVLDMLAHCFAQLGQGHKALTVLKELARIHDRNGLISERNEVLERILDVDPSDLSARHVLQSAASDEPVEDDIGFEEFIAFEELEDDVSPRRHLRVVDAELPDAEPGFEDAYEGSRPGSESQRRFDDLEELADLVAAEPVAPRESSGELFDAAEPSRPGDSLPLAALDSVSGLEVPPAAEAEPAREDDEDFVEIGFGDDVSRSQASAAKTALRRPTRPREPSRPESDELSAVLAALGAGDEEASDELAPPPEADDGDVDELSAAIAAAEAELDGEPLAPSPAPAVAPEPPDVAPEPPEVAPVPAEAAIEVPLDDIAEIEEPEQDEGELELEIEPAEPEGGDELELDLELDLEPEEPGSASEPSASSEPGFEVEVFEGSLSGLPVGVESLDEDELREASEPAGAPPPIPPSLMADTEDAIDVPMDFDDEDFVELSDTVDPIEPADEPSGGVLIAPDLPGENAGELDELEELLDSEGDRPEDSSVAFDSPDIAPQSSEIGFDEAEVLGGESIPGHVPADLADELREFDFYLRNDMVDTARSVLQDLSEAHRAHPEVQRRLSELEKR